MTKITIELAEEDLENAPHAIAFAIGVLVFATAYRTDPIDQAMIRQASARLNALCNALKAGRVET